MTSNLIKDFVLALLVGSKSEIKVYNNNSTNRYMKQNSNLHSLFTLNESVQSL